MKSYIRCYAKRQICSCDHPLQRFLKIQFCFPPPKKTCQLITTIFANQKIVMLRSESAQSFTLWQQAKNAYQPTTSLPYCLFAPQIYQCYSSRTSRLRWIAHLTQRQPRGCKRNRLFATVAQNGCFSRAGWDKKSVLFRFLQNVWLPSAQHCLQPARLHALGWPSFQGKVLNWWRRTLRGSDQCCVE